MHFSFNLKTRKKNVGFFDKKLQLCAPLILKVCVYSLCLEQIPHAPRAQNFLSILDWEFKKMEIFGGAGDEGGGNI